MPKTRMTNQRRVILEKRADIAPHVVVLAPGLRNEHQQRMLQRPPGCHKKLQHIIQTGGVTLRFVDKREQFT